MKEVKMMIGGGVDTDGLTATAAHVRAGDTFISGGNDEAQTGTLTDRSKIEGLSVPDLEAPLFAPDAIKTLKDSNGNMRVMFAPPSGDYPGGENGAYVGALPSEIGVTADRIANGKTAAGVAGTYGNDATAEATDIKAGMIAYNANGKVSGSQTDYGNISKTLAAGESYDINEGFYGKGKVTAKDMASQAAAAVSTFGITAAKVAKGQTIAGVAGSFYGNKKCIYAFAARGFGMSSSDYETHEEMSFTMPSAGTVFYGGGNAGYDHTSKCQILVNGTVKDSRDTDRNGDWWSGWRGTMFNKSLAVNKGDVIKVICEQSAGTHGMSCIQAVCVY